MLKTEFKDKLEFDIYLIEQKVRAEKGYLTRSEQETLKKMQEKDYKPHFIKEEKIKSAGLPIITNISELRKPCGAVEKGEDVSDIIRDLKDTLEAKGGIGISANQIGINKRISYIKIPKFINKNKQIQYNDFILINAKIIEHDRPIKVMNEGCLSFPGIYVHTRRYVFITVEYLNEKLEHQIMSYQDMESIAMQHEIDHQEGRTIFDKKWRAK